MTEQERAEVLLMVRDELVALRADLARTHGRVTDVRDDLRSFRNQSALHWTPVYDIAAGVERIKAILRERVETPTAAQPGAGLDVAPPPTGPRERSAR